MSQYTIAFHNLKKEDLSSVGAKNAALGEMTTQLASHVQVPAGFAVTTKAYQAFLAHNQLTSKIQAALVSLDVMDMAQLTQVSENIRQWISVAQLPDVLIKEITEALEQLQNKDTDLIVAVRSSATAEDLPQASFAGQQDSFLNISGVKSILEAVKAVYASLFSERAITYRVHQGISHDTALMAVAIQKMVCSDTAGVMFSLDTESGFDQVVLITASYGLGEGLVQGSVNPDEFYVHKSTLAQQRPAILRRALGNKATQVVCTQDQRVGHAVKTIEVEKEQRGLFALNDADILALANQAVAIEKYYGYPVDIEWAKDGKTGALYILQARPETVKSRAPASTLVERYLLKEKGELLLEGRSIGQKISKGIVRIVTNIREMHQLQAGEILVTDMTDPDWEPVMKRAAAIVTNRGGRTCHAAIIARELGIPAVVGCGDATDLLSTGQQITVSCAEGDTGKVYQGLLDFVVKTNTLESMPALPVNIMMNVGNPDRAFDFQSLPHKGIGLARLEFIINRMIGVHPKALMNYDNLPKDLKKTVDRRIAGYAGPVEFYVQKLVEGIATLAAAFAPERVIVRLSDFKSNEYANLIGGRLYEPEEENPLLGFRGATRYISENFRDCFALECQALKYVREVMGFQQVEVMVPFVRTLAEAEQVIDLLAAQGLKRGENGLKIIMMCELPANVLLADEFLKYFDGFSIGSNDLTQLTLGLDRDSAIVAHLFDERDPAVKMLLTMAIKACKKAGKYIGICGQGPSEHPDLARWLMAQGIDSISLSPESVLKTWFSLAEK